MSEHEELFETEQQEPFVIPDDVRKIKLVDRLRMTEDQVDVLKIKYGSATGLKNEDDLTRRIQEYIHVYSLCNRPLRTVNIGRRFNRVASNLDTNISSVLQLLTGIGAVHWFERGSTRFVFSKSIWGELIEGAKEFNVPISDTEATLIGQAL